MKLRQKLAVVLATAMVVTAVPVVTSAATTTIKKATLKIEKGDTFSKVATANAVKINFEKNEITVDKENPSQTEVIYLTLENAEWSDDAFTAAFTKEAEDGVWTHNEKDGITTTFAKQSSKVMKVTMTFTEDLSSDTSIALPLLVTATGGEAKVTVENKGNGSLAKKETFAFATTSDSKVSVTVGDAVAFYASGEIPKITVEEAYPGALKDGGEFTIDLNNDDFVFVEGTATATGMYGFSGEKEIQIKHGDHRSSVTITLPATNGDGSNGVYEITGIKVKSTERNPEAGDLTADITSVEDSLSVELTDVKLATISDYGTYIKMKDDKPVEIKAGRKAEVEFEIGELVADSFASGRDFELTLENGHWDYEQLVRDAGVFLDKDKDEDKDEDKDAPKKDESDNDESDNDRYKGYSADDFKKAALKIDGAKLAELLLANYKDWDNCSAEFAEEDGKAVVETIYFTVGSEDVAEDKEEKLKFQQKICVPIDKREAGQVTLKASGRALQNELSTTVMTVLNPFTIAVENAELKVGLQGQVSGSVTLTETDKDMFQKGEITFKIKDADEKEVGIYLTDVNFVTSDAIKGEVTGTNKDDKSATVELTRTTKEAATIEFKDLKFTTDRTVPEGTYALEISGPALDVNGGTITVEDFIKITTANTEDITANGLSKGTSVFVIGESKYTVNGEERPMDGASYIKDPGYTMVPVRYVAEAFGVTTENILFANGTATIFAGNRTVQLTNGSNIAVVNGTQVPMATAVEIKDDRTYAPIGEVAGILGLTREWDATAKIATFINK